MSSTPSVCRGIKLRVKQSLRPLDPLCSRSTSTTSPLSERRSVSSSGRKRLVFCNLGSGSRVACKPTLTKVFQNLEPCRSTQTSFCATSAVTQGIVLTDDLQPTSKALKALVAGDDIGGLFFALLAELKGYQVNVFTGRLPETPHRPGRVRGLIHLTPEELELLQATVPEVYKAVLKEGCTTLDRINGVVDGITGQWYCKLDTWEAEGKQCVISHKALKNILLGELSTSSLWPSSKVMSYKELPYTHERSGGVAVVLNTNEVVEGDLLVAADGVHSRVRARIICPMPSTQDLAKELHCFTGVCSFLPPDVKMVGFRTYLGDGCYFVSGDVGDGMQEWFAFLGRDSLPLGRVPQELKQFLRQAFDGWCDGVTDIIEATPEKYISASLVEDEPSMPRSAYGRVALLGEAAHAHLPVIGQGGASAIGEAYQLISALQRCQRTESESEAVSSRATASGTDGDERAVWLDTAMEAYQQQLDGFSAKLLPELRGIYEEYVTSGLGPIAFLLELDMAHPYRELRGREAFKRSFPFLLDIVLGGSFQTMAHYVPFTSNADPSASGTFTPFTGDSMSPKSTMLQWVLVRTKLNASDPATDYDLLPLTAEATWIGREPLVQGSGFLGLAGSGTKATCVVDVDTVSREHARMDQGSDHSYYTITDLGTSNGTFVNRGRLRPFFPKKVYPGDVVVLGDERATFRIKLRRDMPATVASEGPEYVEVEEHRPWYRVWGRGKESNDDVAEAGKAQAPEAAGSPASAQNEEDIGDKPWLAFWKAGTQQADTKEDGVNEDNTIEDSKRRLLEVGQSSWAFWKWKSNEEEDGTDEGGGKSDTNRRERQKDQTVSQSSKQKVDEESGCGVQDEGGLLMRIMPRSWWGISKKGTKTVSNYPNRNRKRNGSSTDKDSV